MTDTNFLSRLRNKIIIYFGFIIVILLSAIYVVEFYGIPFTGFEGEYKNRQSEVFQKLSLVADLKKERLLHWFNERAADIDVLVASSLVKDFVENIINNTDLINASAAENNALWKRLKQETFYQNLIAHLNLVKLTYGFYDHIEIADTQTGTTIATTFDQDIGKKIPQTDIFSAIINPGDAYITIEKDPHARGRFTLIMAHSIDISNHEKKVKAVLIMYINPDDFIKPLLHTGDGLGKTGEALLVNNNVKLLVPLKHPLADGSIAVPLEYEITAQAATLAAHGEEGIVISEDYRNITVLAAYRHINISKEFSWGMVVKRDLADVYAPLWKSRKYTRMVGWTGAIIALLLVGLASNKLTKPIHLMSLAAKRIESGDLTVRVPVVSSDEIGYLARSFNAMVNRIQHWTAELEEQVNNRTAQLEEANLHLMANEQQLKASNQQLMAGEQQLKASNQQLIAGEQQLKASNQQLKVKERELIALVKTKEVLLKEIHHRVKNNLQIVSSLLYLESKNIKDKKSLDIFKKSHDRIDSMSFIHDKLYQSGDLSNVNVIDYIRVLSDHLFDSYGIDRKSIKLNIITPKKNIPLGIDVAIPCGLIINELVTNSLKHAFDKGKKGEINIEFSSKANSYTLIISDNGRGMPENIDFRKTKSLGLQLVQTLINQLNGEFSLIQGAGTCFKITFLN